MLLDRYKLSVANTREQRLLAGKLRGKQGLEQTLRERLKDIDRQKEQIANELRLVQQVTYARTVASSTKIDEAELKQMVKKKSKKEKVRKLRVQPSTSEMKMSLDAKLAPIMEVNREHNQNKPNNNSERVTLPPLTKTEGEQKQSKQNDNPNPKARFKNALLGFVRTQREADNDSREDENSEISKNNQLPVLRRRTSLTKGNNPSESDIVTMKLFKKKHQNAGNEQADDDYDKYLPDGSLKTFYMLSKYKISIEEACKHRYLRTRHKNELDRLLTVEEIFSRY